MLKLRTAPVPARAPAPPAIPPLKGAFVLVNAHGGAGSSTLARLLDPAGSGRVVVWRPGMPAPPGRYPVLITRTTALGLNATAWMLTHWRPEAPRPVLLTVADAPYRPPSVVRYRIKAVSGQVAAVLTVPYLPILRGVDDPAAVAGHRSVAAALQRLRRDLDALDLQIPASKTR